MHNYSNSILGISYLPEMIFIPAGIFQMGSDDEEINSRSTEKPRHKVSIDSFLMSKHPITQLQWKGIASRAELKVVRDLDPDPSRFKGDTKPVERVSWYDAIEFCARVSKLTGQKYRLPSEAEWEYACRAGTTTLFYSGEKISPELANYAPHYAYDDDTKRRYPVGTTSVDEYAANAFGLYDMHGNVYEWCLDNWHDNYVGAPIDGSAWLEIESDARVLRGGSWRNHNIICRSSARTWDWGRRRRSVHGFRVVCPVARDETL